MAEQTDSGEPVLVGERSEEQATGRSDASPPGHLGFAGGDRGANASGEPALRRSWPVQRTAMSFMGMAGVAALLALAAGLLQRWMLLPIGVAAMALGLATTVVALAAAALACNLYTCQRMHYIVGECFMSIIRGTSRWDVPLAAIQSISDGEPRAVISERVLMPGFTIGRGYIKDGGAALFFTTAPTGRSVAVQTPECTYLLSPQHPAAFVAEIESRRSVAPAAEAAKPGPGVLFELTRPLPMALAAFAALTNAALYLYVAWWYPALPARLPVHFAAGGLPDRWGPPEAVFWLPQIGSVALLTNLVLALFPPLRRPPTTLVLLAGAGAVQILLSVAFATLLP